MKKQYASYILFAALIVFGCKKENKKTEIEEDSWKSPTCEAENSLLKSMMVVNGKDTSITDYAYDNQHRLVEVKSRSRNQRETTIEYPGDNRYIVYSYNHDTVSSVGHVYLSSERKMDSVLMSSPNNSYTKTNNYYTYDSRNRRIGFDQYYYSNPSDPGGIITRGIFEWDDLNNVTKVNYWYSSEDHYTRYEYFEDVTSYLYQTAEPYSGFYFGYPFPENTDAIAMSKNLKKRSYNENGSTDYTPEFDMGDRLIKFTETSYNNAGSATGVVYRYFLYECK